MATNSKSDRQIPTFLGSDMLDDGDSLAAAAVTRFLGRKPGTTLSRVSQGLSGGTVYRCSTNNGSFALKCWPAETTGQRVDEVHHVQRYAGEQLSRDNRFTFKQLGQSFHPLVPKLSDLGGNQYRLTLADRHFDLSTWMPGAAFREPTVLAAGDAESAIASVSGLENPLSITSAIKAGAAAIARFHQATVDLGSEFLPAPAVIRRLKRLEELRQELPLALANAYRLTGPAKVAAEHLTQHWHRMQRDSEAVLRIWELKPVTLQWVLRDVHREHVLFENDEVSGIVDFDAVRRDTVATDLARWVGSFAESGFSPELLWDAAITGYASVREISPCEQRLSGAIEQASWYIHLANWVTWIADESQNFPGGMVSAQRRVTALLRRSDVRISS